MTDTLGEPESIWIDRGPNGGWMFRTEKLHDSVRQYVPAARIIALEEEIEKLREALLDHNDALRSANSIAAREGAQTNWATFREKCAETLEDYHDLTNQIRKDAGEPVYAPRAALGETK